ncbi:lysosomal proton-coupled steroid conjugate and bile acid symporter SLC46A3-like [Panulirus ornatus]|uniref:lysosomal proton-coupled steroid conjugate and bile acid symporter SLC46A3-like n=1 Tax=Panulirus ornatus TaxID=150431 RepID=UPI003A866B23
MFKLTVEPAVFLYSFGYTVQLSVQQDFIFSRLCRDNYSESVCEKSWEPEVAKEVWRVQVAAVRRVMWMSVMTGLIAVVTSQLLGAALDRYSRKVVMLAPFLGSLALHLVCLVVAAVPSLTLDLLYLGAALNGATGGFVVFKSSVSSYVVSLARSDERTAKLALVEGMLFLGNAAGPFALQLVSAYLIRRHSYLFLGNEGVIVAATLYIIFFLPDYSVVRDRTTRPATGGAGLDNARRCTSIMSLLGEFSNAVAITFRKRAAGVRVMVVLLLFSDFFIAIVYSAEFDLLYLYMQDKLGFTLTQYSQYLAFKNLVNGMSLLMVLPGLVWLFGMSDGALGLLGGISRVVAFTFLALTTSHKLVFLVPFLDVFGQYLFVVLRSIITSLVAKDEQGRVLTVMSAMAQVSLLAGSVIFDCTYPVFLAANHPGHTFLMAAAFMAAATIILGYIQWWLKAVNRREELQPLLQ